MTNHPNRSRRKPDIITNNHGSLVSFTVNSVRGRRWCAKHLQITAPYATRFVEHRYAPDIIIGAVEDDLFLQDAITGNRATLPPDYR